jgi:S1-C subfamily serine protease
VAENGLQGLSSEDRKVLPGSPAEKAGLLTGDQLIAAKGIEIREVKEIHHALSEKGWGKDITLTLHREGKKKEWFNFLH